MKRVLRFWWGNNISTMSEHRKNCFQSIYSNSGIETIEFITPWNYKQYEVTEHPFHEGFEYLSEVHKGDYLRAYIIYYFGGCWTDVKYIDHDWNRYFDLLEQNPDKWGIGFQEMIIDPKTQLYRVHNSDHPHAKCISMAHFIFRKKTPLFFDYISRIEYKINQKIDLLKKYPGSVHPLICSDKLTNMGVKGFIPEHLLGYNYPLEWMELSGTFFHVQSLPSALGKVMYGMPPANNYTTGYNHR